MTTAETDNGKQHLPSAEEVALGKKLASRIKAEARKHLLYQKFPEDAALFLQIWARYGSKDDVSKYLTESFQSKPENAIALLKSYLTASVKPDSGLITRNEFTRRHYDALIEVTDPDSISDALVRLYQSELEGTEEIASGDLSDRAIAYQFLRIYHGINNNNT